MDHEIFKTPTPVQITLVDRKSYPYLPLVPGDAPAPESLPMWRVQTVGDLDKRGTDYQLFGLVSRGRGFLDSPDTEFISGGVNSKQSGAVALGRHGNYFHWGFCASPTHLTDEAKTVFVNAVHYIAKFDRKTIVARKRPGTILRDLLERELAAVERGEHPKGVEALKRYFPEAAWEAVEKTPGTVAKELRANAPYLYPVGWYEIAVDEDLKALRTPNAGRDFLTQMETFLTKPTTSARAIELLTRYSDETFVTAAEWQSWLAKDKDTFFFCESAGYKWLKNTAAATPVEASAPK